ncbi:DUF732 domain-containing protein [Gordonia sp. DT219]|uniref:DUF732 domain-containing protein n=1 Tax=Gordonia sp. DT219 TaxID=3416658 RepID=UPI003CF483B5
MRAVLAAGCVLGAVLLGGCGSSDNAADSAASGSVTTSSESATSSVPASTTTSSHAPAPSASPSAPPSRIELPSQGTAETVAPPASGARSAFLATLRDKGVNLDPDTAVSLGHSVCHVRKTGGEDAARQFAAPVMKQSTGTQATDAQVAAFVDASRGLC